MSYYCDCMKMSEREYEWRGGKCIERKENNFELCGFILAEYVCMFPNIFVG